MEESFAITTTEEAIAQGSTFCMFTHESQPASPLLDHRMQVIVIIILIIFKDKIFLFLVKIKLPREAEHSNFKLFPLVYVLTPLSGKLSIWHIKQTQPKVLTVLTKKTPIISN